MNSVKWAFYVSCLFLLTVMSFDDYGSPL